MSNPPTLQPTDPPPVEVPAGSNDRLSQLHAAYADKKAAADAAAAELKTITDALKVELTNAAGPAARKIELVGPDGPKLRLSYSETWRFDSKRFKAEDPETYVRYAVQGGSWTLKAGS
ncbi:hypothetical protein [Nocardioides sp. 503]|uniref:hypothetical protein n=1 Tax=Nocardioides sp. 503 TaxID=2508326 RepID=UPI00106F8FB5|nr:hypothetical protein [Nocardioides sp. 503]